MKVASPFLATSFALSLVVLGSVAPAQTAAPARAPAVQVVSIESSIPGVPADALPRAGECKIWYDGLSPQRQPASMECEHAHWVARRWGGRVIANTATGAVEQARYNGDNDFTGVPETALPHRGYCRAWLKNTADENQPAQADCRTARREAAEAGGRVLFMPL